MGIAGQVLSLVGPVAFDSSLLEEPES